MNDVTKDFVTMVLGKSDVINAYDKMMSVTVNSVMMDILFEVVDSNSDILTNKIDSEHFVFDYFFYYGLKHCPITLKEKWLSELCYFCGLLSGLGEWGNVIKSNPEYILTCQHDSCNYGELFDVLFDNDFDLGDVEFLIYSVIARGELSKLKKIYEVYTIEEHSGIFSTALRFGRDEIINFLIESDIDVNDYGNIIHFEHYVENPRLIYYRREVCDALELERIKSYGPVLHSSFNYLKCLQDLKECGCKFVASITTIDIWCGFIKSKIYEWDVVEIEVLEYLKSLIKDDIPVDHDFGEFSEILHGSALQTRSNLMEIIRKLESKVVSLEDRTEKLKSMNMKLKERCEYLERRVHVRRRRCVTK